MDEKERYGKKRYKHRLRRPYDLYLAIQWGKVDSVRRELERGADPNARKRRGRFELLWERYRTPLGLALDPWWGVRKRFDPEIVRLLLEYGADPNDCWISREQYLLPLECAVHQESPEAVQALLEYGANGQQARQTAAWIALYRYPRHDPTGWTGRPSEQVGDVQPREFFLARARAELAAELAKEASVAPEREACVPAPAFEEFGLDAKDVEHLNWLSSPAVRAEAQAEGDYRRACAQAEAEALRVSPEGRAANQRRAERCRECLRLILEAGLDVNRDDDGGALPLLVSAVKDGCWETVQLLLAHGADATIRVHWRDRWRIVRPGEATPEPDMGLLTFAAEKRRVRQKESPDGIDWLAPRYEEMIALLRQAGAVE